MKQSKLFEEIGSNQTDTNPKTAAQKYSDEIAKAMSEKKLGYTAAAETHPADVLAGEQERGVGGRLLETLDVQLEFVGLGLGEGDRHGPSLGRHGWHMG